MSFSSLRTSNRLRLFAAAFIAALLACVLVAVIASGVTYVNVRDYGATGNGTTNDTQAFEKAMNAAGTGEVVYVPAGTYRIAGVNIPSDTDMQIESTATLKKYGTANGPLFVEQGPTDTAFAHDIYIQGVNGRFLVDLNDAGQETGFIRLENVKNFSVKNFNCKQNWDNHTQEAPSSMRPCLSFNPSTTTRNSDGTYNAPMYGTVENASAKQSPYGWGLVQTSGGAHLDFVNISGKGGITLRLENYSRYTPMSDIYASGVSCLDGHAAVSFNPHGAVHPGPFEIHNVTSNSCEEGVSINGDGSYNNASIDTLRVTAGNTAQVRDPADTTYVSAWLIGSWKYCVADKTNAYSVKLTNVSCGGLPNS